MHLPTSRILAVSVLASLLLLASCSKSASNGGESAKPSPSAALPKALVAHPYKDLRDLPGTVFDVHYTPQTVRIDEASWRASLRSVSSDGNVFVFDHPDAAVSSLHEGSTMFLEN